MRLMRDFTNRVFTGFVYAPSVQIDNTPNQITGQTITGVALNAEREFDPVQITGIDVQVTASITNGSFRVSTDGVTYGAYSAATQPVEDGYWIQVKNTASGTAGANVDAVLSVGGVTATFRLTTLADTAVYPYVRSVTWEGEKTPVLVIGDTFRHRVTINSDGAAYDASTATDISACIVSLDHSVKYNDAVSIAAEAGWESGLITILMDTNSTAEIAEYVTAECFAWLELQATFSGGKYTWFGAVRLVPGHIA